MTRDGIEDAQGTHGGRGADSRLEIDALCSERGWSRSTLVRALRRTAISDGHRLPGDDTLKRMIREWNSGRREPSVFYRGLLMRTFQVVEPAVDQAVPHEITMARDIDLALIVAFEQQTSSLRLLDRRIGAQMLLTQTREHLRNISEIAGWATFGVLRRKLAGAGAEAAALAGWQALDLTDARTSWKLHTTARQLALESEDPSVIAHVSAQQAFVLIDLGEYGRAIEHLQGVREQAGTFVPHYVQAWLYAAEAEARAAANAPGVESLLDKAQIQLDSADHQVPFIVLDDVHLARWRGACLAQIGHRDALPLLNSALQGIGTDFTRATAGLHIDLATAHTHNGDAQASDHHATIAARLSHNASSIRQRRRLMKLLAAKR